MKLDEIKNGMYVKLRNGDLEFVISDKFMKTNGCWNDRNSYDENELTNKVDDKWDIMEVFVSSSPILFNENGFQRVWVRTTLNVKIGDIFEMYNNRYLVILRIDDDDDFPYVGLKFTMHENDSFDFEPFSVAELNDFTYVRHVDGLDVINEKIQGLINGTI